MNVLNKEVNNEKNINLEDIIRKLDESIDKKQLDKLLNKNK